MARLLSYASVPPLTTNSLGPSVAPLSPAPLLQRLGMNVFIGLAMGGLVLVGLLLALGRLFDMNRKLEEARLAEAAAGAAAGEAPAEAAGAKKRLQRATPVVVIQPDREVRSAMDGKSSRIVYIYLGTYRSALTQQRNLSNPAAVTSSRGKIKA